MKLSSRTYILLGLVLATAVSAMLQYATQGILATGHDASFFPKEFWVVEGVLWGFRALVEACVVAFLFSTKGTTTLQNVVLGGLEFVLVVLIAATLGPVFAATGYGLTMKETLPKEWYWVWNFGIGSYPSLMIGSAAFAWKIDRESEAAPVKVQSGTGPKQERRRGESKIDRLVPPFVELVAEYGDQWLQKDYAEKLAVSIPDMSKVAKRAMENGLVLKPNGHYESVRA